MAATGARVFAGVRNVAKGQDALGDMLQSGRVELLKMDLSSLDSVRQAAEEFKGKSKGLNVLINNAGISPPSSILDSSSWCFRSMRRI